MRAKSAWTAVTIPATTAAPAIAEKSPRACRTRTVYSRMISPLACAPEIKKLLPVDDESFNDIRTGSEDEEKPIDLLPSPAAVLDSVVPNYIHGVIYGALVESFCSEQNSRMLAMQSATNNAKEMLHDLNIESNRIRQAAITQEITEVIAGAKAQKKKQE